MYFRAADDFVVSAPTHVTGVSVYVYQTGSTTTSPITFGNLRIWSGFPEAATSTLVFGDTTTNHMTSTNWTNAYRYSSIDASRPIMEVNLGRVVDLAPGTYYVDFTTMGSSSFTGPWAVPITIPGLLVTGNAVQRVNGPNQWQPINDSSSATEVYGQGLPFKVNYTTGSITPVELKSFTANIERGDVILSWVTATELNNKGFEIERKTSSGNFEKIGFVAGHGTTTDANYYSFVNKSLANGKYSYRLKQIDLDGSVSYSYNVEVDVNVPELFNLEQNYPNPFNPSTAIKFSLAVDSKVALKVFNLLGEVVLANIQNMTSGNHTVNFNGSSLSSGIYFYQLEANGVNGSNFTSVKKMTLIK